MQPPIVQSKQTARIKQLLFTKKLFQAFYFRFLWAGKNPFITPMYLYHIIGPYLLNEEASAKVLEYSVLTTFKGIRVNGYVCMYVCMSLATQYVCVLKALGFKVRMIHQPITVCFAPKG